MVTSPGNAWSTKAAAGAVLFSLLLTHAPGADEGSPLALRVFSHASYRPYAYFENAEAKGLAIDLLQELARRLDRPLDVMPVELEQSKERLARGEADAFFPMVRMDGTDEQFDFSDPVYTLHFAIFTSAARSEISSVDNLRGLRVGATASGFGRQLLQDDATIQLVPMNDYAHGIALLRAGDIDALIADRWVGTSEVAARSIRGVRVASGDVTTLPAMLMVRKGDTAQLSAFNRALRTMHEDGTIERLLEKWRPPEAVFVPGEPANWPAIVGGFSLLLGLLAVMGAWTIVLRREVALRREREQEVAALHQRLAIATQAGGIGIWDWDVARDVLVWDDEMLRLYGVRREDFTGNFAAWVQIVHPDDRDRAEAEVRAALAGDRPYDTEFRIRLSDGTTRVIRAHAETFRSSADRPARMVGVNEDVTASKQAAVALVQSAERLRVALAASRLGIWRYDMRTHIVDWDERTHAIFDVPRDETPPAGEAFLALAVEEDRPSVRAAWINRVRSDEPYHVRFRTRRRDGVLRHIELHGIVHADAAGRPEWIIGVVNDVTDVVRAAEEAGRLRDQLLQSQKMETLGTLAAGIAHDFNNLLTGINGFVELGAVNLPREHEALAFLTNARRGVSQASDLVRRILQFSRRSSSSRRASIRLDQAVRETTPLLSAVLPANVAIQVEICPNLPPVLADTVQMQQVLMNLCVNGAHAIGSRDGVVRIAVGVREFPAPEDAPSSPGIPPGRYVRLAVTDTGCGMDEPTLARIFDPYFTTKEEGRGTGLGLAVVRGIVAEHAGVMNVESAVDIGTTFEILLPATTGEAAPVAIPEQPVVRGEGQRLLVVDDEQAVVEVARLALTRVGYLVETRTSPVEAWRAFAAAPGRFDLLLVDQQMPEMPGTELIRRVRGMATSIPIVMMSGQFEHIDTDEVRCFGRISLLEKPFDIGVLANTVETALRNHGAIERRAG